MADSVILVGGGGHAKVVLDALASQGIKVSHYLDPQNSAWLENAGITRLDETGLPKHPRLVMGFVGLDCAALERRYNLMRRYIDQGAVFPPVVHASAIVSGKVELAPGVQLLPGSIINSHSKIAEGAIINSGAVIEHDVSIGAGTHIAPRAVVLGGAQVEDGCYVGSGSVIIQGARVTSKSFIKALNVHK